MLRKLILALPLLLASHLAGAMTWQELHEEIQNIEAGRLGDPQLIRRLGEMIEMMVVYTKALHETNPEAVLFCPGRGTSIHIDEIISIIRAEARSSQAADSTLVQSLLLEGYRARFPCS